MGGYLAILEDDEERTAAMRNRMADFFHTYEPVFFDNGPDMIDWLQNYLPSTVLICLDHDLGPSRIRNGEAFDPGTGRDVVDFLSTQKPHCPIIIHTSNYLAAQGMEMILNDSGWMNSRVIPVNELQWVDSVWVPEVQKYLGDK